MLNMFLDKGKLMFVLSSDVSATYSSWFIDSALRQLVVQRWCRFIVLYYVVN